MQVPFLRIIIPFIAGIFTAFCFPANTLVSFAKLSSLLCIVTGLWWYEKSNSKSKYFLLAAIDIFLFVYAIMLVFLTNKSNQPLYYARLSDLNGDIKFVALVDELPLEKEKSIKLSLRLLEVKVDSAYTPVTGNIIAYLRKSLKAKKIRAGDELLIRAKLSSIPPPGNPNEFDYKNYLANKQVYHSLFLDSGLYEPLALSNRLNVVWKTGLQCKAFILSRLKSSALSANSYAICCALLTGYDDEIDKSVMTAFSHSGTLHVLSVSGLHTGLIYLVLGFLFDLADRRKKFKLLRFALITIVLWLFALITGFSSPVLRAVIMFNLLGFGKLFFRQDARNQMNILLVSAFILLVYNPFFITDVGFLLSYFALAGLIFFQPKLSALFRQKNYILNSLWQSIAASFAATISTLPLTLFYFKQFPLWFFVCNIVVVPATFVILLLGVLVVVKLNFAALLINFLINFLILFINAFDNEGYGFVDMINFEVYDALFLSILILFASLAFEFRTPRLVFSVMIILISWQILAIASSFSAKHNQLFTAYHVKKKSVFSVKNKTIVTLTNVSASDYGFM